MLMSTAGLPSDDDFLRIVIRVPSFNTAMHPFFDPSLYGTSIILSYPALMRLKNSYAVPTGAELLMILAPFPCVQNLPHAASGKRLDTLGRLSASVCNDPRPCVFLNPPCSPLPMSRLLSIRNLALRRDFEKRYLVILSEFRQPRPNTSVEQNRPRSKPFNSHDEPVFELELILVRPTATIRRHGDRTIRRDTIKAKFIGSPIAP